VPGAFARELTAERPTTPDASYGVPAKGGTFVGWAECVERLRTAEAYWLATTGPKGSPHVVPVWGVMVDDDLYLETGAVNTTKARDLRSNPAVAVHLDGVNDALIVHGRAEDCRPDPALAAALAAAFTAKYAGYAPAPTDWDDGGLHRIEPRVMLAWRDMPTATRWRFPPE
jgi:nitroimidazol reductase NimA-like FMN-containing flavoprotein (pyridoxamine 5'-phosphate oxidase superfamily)